jgi:hypothetical protein
MLLTSYTSLAIDEDDRAAGYKLMAKLVWDTYMSKIPQERIVAIGLPSLEDMDREALKRMLDPAGKVPVEARAVIRTKLGMPAEKAAPPESEVPSTPTPASTNAPPEKVK